MAKNELIKMKPVSSIQNTRQIHIKMLLYFLEIVLESVIFSYQTKQSEGIHKIFETINLNLKT